MTRYRRGWICAICVLAEIVASAACASLGALGQIVQPPRFAEAGDREAELRFLAPSTNMPIGGAGVRIWLEVTNPNAFGFSVSTMTATLLLEGNRAATGDFPLGLPLQAGQQIVVPLDLAVSFSDLPGLAGTLRRIAVGGVVPYVLEGTVGVDAGTLGKPSFGPMRLTTGELRVAPTRSMALLPPRCLDRSRWRGCLCSSPLRSPGPTRFRPASRYAAGRSCQTASRTRVPSSPPRPPTASITSSCRTRSFTT